MKIYVVTVDENEITVSLNGEAAVTKTVKPTLTALGNGRIRFLCDDIDEEVETYRHIFINGVSLKGSWIAEEDYLAVTLFDKVMGETFVSSGSDGGSSYLVYTALLTQTGTNAPVITVLQNTLGGTPTSNYQSVGSYFLTLTNGFPSGKTVCFIQESNYFGTSLFGIYRDNDNTVYISSEGWGGSDWELTNGILVDVSIEIRVYL